MTLPQLSDAVFITDGGLETTLIFHDGFDLPRLRRLRPARRRAPAARGCARYYEPYIAIAREHGVGVVLDTPTWRANPDWGPRLGYSARGARRASTGTRSRSSTRCARADGEVVVSGCIGPRGDG